MNDKLRYIIAFPISIMIYLTASVYISIILIHFIGENLITNILKDYLIPYFASAVSVLSMFMIAPKKKIILCIIISILISTYSIFKFNGEIISLIINIIAPFLTTYFLHKNKAEFIQNESA